MATDLSVRDPQIAQVVHRGGVATDDMRRRTDRPLTRTCECDGAGTTPALPETTMPMNLESIDDVAAYAAERTFIRNQIGIMFKDGKGRAEILGWLLAGVKAAGDKANLNALRLNALRLWLEREFPREPVTPHTTEYIDTDL